MRSVTRLTSILVALAAPLAAHAGGFTTTRFGGEDGHAATSDVTAAFYNPAGLAYGTGTRGYVEGLFVYRTVDYRRDASAIDNSGTGTPTAATGANSGAAKLANPIISPFLGLATDLGIKGVGIGFSLAVPFGGQAKWSKVADDPNFPGAVDSSARWASIEGEQRSLYYTLAGGWHTPGGRFAIGAGVNLVQSKIALVRARNFDGSDDLVRPNGSVAEGRSLLEVDSLDLAASVGVMWKPTPCSRVGVSYHSQPGFGEMKFTGTLTNQFGESSPTTIDVELRQQLPDAIRIGGIWRAATKLILHAAIDYQRWSKFQNQCFVTPGAPTSACAANRDGTVADSSPLLVNIPRAWKNTYGVRAGATYEISDALRINGGLLFDSNAVPDATLDPALIDTNKVIPQLGMHYRAGKVSINATAGHVIYLSRTTAARTVDPTGKNRNPDMAGDYSTAATYLVFGIGVAM